MSTTTAELATGSRGELSHKQILTILAGLILGMFLAALDQTVVATAARTIADDLGGLSEQAWATTAFLVTSTISTPLYGKLSDILGRKPLFLSAISIFVFGSVLCTFSQSMYMLAGFRAVQGLGAGGLMALALTILGDIIPPRERARYQGYMLAVFATSSVLGPVIGGLFAGTASLGGIAGWRWIFLINVPVGITALIVVTKVLNLPHTRQRARIDWPGALTLTIGLVPLLLIAEQGREWGWASTAAIICYAAGAIGLTAFLACEHRLGDDALLPLRLFRNRVFSLTSLAGVIIGMGMFGGIALFPQFLQIVRGVSPTESGLLLLPLIGGTMIASVFCGQLTSRTGRYKIFPVAGSAMMVAAMAILHFRLTPDIALWELDLYMAMFGIGLGGCMQTLVLAVQNAVPARDMGVATASATFFRQTGGTLGIAIFLSILFTTLPGKITAAFAGHAGQVFRSALTDPAVLANPANQQIVHSAQTGNLSAASGVLNDSAFLQQIDPSSWSSPSWPWPSSPCCSSTRSRCAPCQAPKPASPNRPAPLPSPRPQRPQMQRHQPPPPARPPATPQPAATTPGVKGVKHKPTDSAGHGSAAEAAARGCCCCRLGEADVQEEVPEPQIQVSAARPVHDERQKDDHQDDDHQPEEEHDDSRDGVPGYGPCSCHALSYPAIGRLIHNRR
jgi:EmrB/QacA subfamily drug resistance transporter